MELTRNERKKKILVWTAVILTVMTIVLAIVLVMYSTESGPFAAEVKTLDFKKKMGRETRFQVCERTGKT